MIANFLLYILFFMLTGCVGDRLAFYKKGNAVVNLNSICIDASPKDTLEFYLLSSSTNKYETPLAVEDDILKKYPNTCFPITLKKSANYELIYTLNGDNYRFEFSTDMHNHVTKTYSKS